MNGTGGERGTSTRRWDAMALLARQAFAPMAPLQRMEGLRSVNARLEARKNRRTAVVIVSILATAAATTGAVLLVRSQTAGDAQHLTIAYSVHGGQIGDGGYIRSFDPAGAVLRFNEGTELRLMSGARGRLSSVDERGARLAIEEGQAEVNVAPRPGARWLVDAGPFLITVRGTVFTAAWNGDSERLDVHMKKGLVSVTGPLAAGVIAVRAGQHLSVNVKTGDVLLRQAKGGSGAAEPPPDTHPEAATTPSVNPPNAQPQPPARGLARPGGRSAPAAGRIVATSGPRSWSAALAAGDLDSILSDAERKGWRRAIAEANSEDLAALADAARYRRRNGVARQALLAERERFPRSSRASDSAFLLGRLEEARPDGEGSALQWYDRYLKEAPSGAYSSEALGRKMLVTERLSGVSAARQVANEYLRRFAGGTYAGAARALRDAP